MLEFDISNFNPIQSNPIGRGTKLKAKIWSLVNSTAFRYSPFFARRFRVFLVNAFGGNVHISCSLNRKCKIEYPWNLTMSELSSLGENSWVYCLEHIVIEKKCCIGKDVYLLTGAHDVNSRNFDLVTKPILIREGTWISTGAYILPGVTVNRFNVVAAGSMVAKGFDEFSIIGGNPAKFLKKRTLK